METFLNFYTVFNTKWGFFALSADKTGLFSTHLPTQNPQKLQNIILKASPNAKLDKNLFKPLQNQITAYFQGTYINFNNDIPLSLDTLTPFARDILTTCQQITYGQTASYSQLADKSNHPKAMRATGTVLSKNPLPLIIPCHRIACANGNIGNFSAPGGKTLKKKLLTHEKSHSPSTPDS